MNELTAHRLAARLRQVEGGPWDAQLATGPTADDEQWYVSDGTARLFQRDLDNALSGDMPGAMLGALIAEQRKAAEASRLTTAISWVMQ